MKLEEYLDKNIPNWIDPCIDPKSLSTFELKTPIKPKEYLAFSEQDILGKDLRGAVNALSNAKRAIDCQVENITGAFGLPKKRSFPERLEQIQTLGLVAPRIVRKIVKTRNLIEHRYAEISVSDAEDAVDIATLFVEATNKLFQHGHMRSLYISDRSTYVEATAEEMASTLIDDESVSWRYREGLWVDYCDENNDFCITVVTGRKEASEKLITQKDPSFTKIIQFIIEHDMDGDKFDESASAQEFINILNQSFLA